MIRVFAAVAVIACLTTGCQDEGIRSAQVPKPMSSAVRTLAVLIPRADATWFLKISGPNDAIAKSESAFRAFADSVSFGEGDKPIRWTLPEKWSEGDAGPQRFATLKTSQGIDATISQLGPEARDVAPNVNRWRGQIGLSALPPDEAAKLGQPITIGGTPSFWIDLVNPGAQPVLLTKSQQPPPPQPPPVRTSGKLTYDAPKDWTVMPASGFRAASFQIGAGDRKAEVTIIPLDGPAGGLAANVNRWRGELGLAESSPEAIKASASEMKVGGEPAPYVDLVASEKKQRTLAVIVSRPERTWFVKMRGAADLVAQQREAFEAFVRSIVFPEGTPHG